jgi:hypothetical protein
MIIIANVLENIDESSVIKASKKYKFYFTLLKDLHIIHKFEFVRSYETLGNNVNRKINFVRSHLDFPTQNRDEVSDRQEESFVKVFHLFKSVTRGSNSETRSDY